MKAKPPPSSICVTERLLNHIYIAVIVTMAVVRMVQVTFYQVIHMVVVWNRLMAAVCAVRMLCVVAAAVVAIRAICGVGGADCQRVLIDVPIVRVVHVPAMKKINVTFVLDRRVAAIGAMLVGVFRVDDVLCHGVLL